MESETKVVSDVSFSPFPAIVSVCALCDECTEIPYFGFDLKNNTKVL